MGYTDNPSAEVNDIMRDHPHMEALIKDLFHSLRIVSEATDPTHPHASKTLCLGAQFDSNSYCMQISATCLQSLWNNVHSHALQTGLQTAWSSEYSKVSL